MPQGHCFPGVIIPKDPDDPADKEELVEVETTMLSPGTTFKAASNYGEGELKKPELGAEVRLAVFIPDMRRHKIFSLELPQLPADVLESKKVTPADFDFSLVGTWKCSFVLNGMAFTTTLTFTADGVQKGTIVDQFGHALPGEGKFTCVDGNYTFTGPILEQGLIKWVNPNEFKYTATFSTNTNQVIGREWLFVRAAN
jgi:hypothetical protein